MSHIRRDVHLVSQADARFDALSKKLQRAYQEKIMMLAEIQMLKGQLRVAPPVPSIAKVNQIVPYNERAEELVMPTENQTEAWNRLVDANIRSGMMASMWCLRTHVFKRIASAFHRWRQNILLVAAPRISGMDNALAVMKKYSTAPVPTVNNKALEPTVADKIPKLEATKQRIDDIEEKRKALLDDARRIMMGSSLLRESEWSIGPNISYPATDDYGGWECNAVKSSTAPDLSNESATSPLDRMKLILSLGDVTSSSVPWSSFYPTHETQRSDPQTQQLRTHSRSPTRIRSDELVRRSLPTATQSPQRRRLQYKGPRYLASTVASSHNVSPKRNRASRTPPRYYAAQDLQPPPSQEFQQRLFHQFRDSPPSPSKWSSDQDSSNMSSSLGRMRKKVRSPSRKYSANSSNAYSGNNSSGTATRPNASYRPIGIDFTNKENIRHDARQPPLPGYLQQTLASKGQRRQRQGLASKKEQSNNIVKSANNFSENANRSSNGRMPSSYPSKQYEQHQQLHGPSRSEWELGPGPAERSTALALGLHAPVVRLGPEDPQATVRSTKLNPLSSHISRVGISADHKLDSKTKVTESQQALQGSTVTIGSEMPKSDVREHADKAPSSQHLDAQRTEVVSLPLNRLPFSTSPASDNETVSDITDQPADGYTWRRGNGGATVEEERSAAEGLNLESQSGRGWDGASCDNSLVHKPCLA